ncbi:DUF6709 family protein [Butyrivibrio sp. VCB2006]|uniref:DUF6709 family protein n=1 Tax=Butyrivibrio sp. VCB2006 TaxID=1280679 RepID=UPI000418F1D1|nr:hypothetical protein [Butyrivibrio sp. VCB2006]
MKCKIDNKYVKSALLKKFLVLIVGALLVVSALAIIAVRSTKTNKLKAESISFAQAYHDGRTNEDIYVNLEIKSEPFEFATISGKESRYYFVSDGDDLYIMKATEENANKYSEAVKDNGSVKVVGPVIPLEPKVAEIALEVYNEGLDPEDQLTREQFYNYFGDVAIHGGATIRTDASDNMTLLVFAMIMLGGFMGVLGLIFVTNYTGTLGRMSDAEAMQITAELDDARTVYIKKCKVFLTPSYVVSLGSSFVAMPYANIRWAYRYNKSINFIPAYTDVKLMGLNFQKVSIAQMPGLAFKKTDVITQIFTAIQQHNPNTAFGYSKELINYFAMLQRQARQQAVQQIKVG